MSRDTEQAVELFSNSEVGAPIPQIAPTIILKSWRDRANTVAYLPGKSGRQVEALRRVVSQLPLPASGEIELPSRDGTIKMYPCEDICRRQLSVSSLVVRNSQKMWCAPEHVLHWSRTNDDGFLAKYLHANVKLFGELLVNIQTDMRAVDLLKVAATYGRN